MRGGEGGEQVPGADLEGIRMVSLQGAFAITGTTPHCPATVAGQTQWHRLLGGGGMNGLTPRFGSLCYGGYIPKPNNVLGEGLANGALG